MVAPRRAGKSLLLCAEGLEAGRTDRHRKAFYASHRRETGAAMWRDDWFEWVDASPLARYLEVRRANGSESITWRHSRSTLRLLPPDGDAMRSFASNLAMIDEAREFTAAQGEAMEAGVFPTQATGAGGQTWIVSSSGTSESEWLLKWRDLGRAAVDAGADRGICHLEYGAPDDADIGDEAVWWAHHPGLGHHVLIDALRADYAVMDPDTFASEYLGIWPTARVDAALVEAWAAATDPTVTLAGAPVFAVETTVERDRTVIVAAGSSATGALTVELVEDRPHGPWVLDRLAELVDRWHPLAVCWDAGGPAAALRRGLDELAARPVACNTREVAAAAGAFHDAVLAGHVPHRPDPAFTDAVAGVRTARAGGTWLFDRRAPAGLPVCAAALAAWVYADQTRHPPTAA